MHEYYILFMSENYIIAVCHGITFENWIFNFFLWGVFRQTKVQARCPAANPMHKLIAVLPEHTC